FWEMARREVQVAVIEAGLGGRYDATSVIESAATVLTNVGFEHTRWLGPTLTDIAEEKLAVLAPGTTLVLGPELAPAAGAVAARLARERAARIERADPAAQPVPRLRARGAFQLANFALARAAARVYLEGAGLPVRERARQLAFERAACEPEPRKALEQAQRWSRAQGGSVLATGSVYLVGDLLSKLGLSGASGARDEGRRDRAR